MPREGCTVNEERILDKLEELGDKTTQLLIGLARVEEQMKDVPDLRNRVTALEKWKWTAVGAMGAASTSLLSQLYTALKGV